MRQVFFYAVFTVRPDPCAGRCKPRKNIAKTLKAGAKNCAVMDRYAVGHLFWYSRQHLYLCVKHSCLALKRGKMNRLRPQKGCCPSSITGERKAFKTGNPRRMAARPYKGLCAIRKRRGRAWERNTPPQRVERIELTNRAFAQPSCV